MWSCKRVLSFFILMWKLLIRDTKSLLMDILSPIAILFTGLQGCDNEMHKKTSIPTSWSISSIKHSNNSEVAHLYCRISGSWSWKDCLHKKDHHNSRITQSNFANSRSFSKNKGSLVTNLSISSNSTCFCFSSPRWHLDFRSTRMIIIKVTIKIIMHW
jgi:hypothetical protein